MADPGEVTFERLLLGGIAFMLLAGGALLVFLVTYQKRLLEQQLRLRTAEAAHQQQILVAIIEAQEGERERIGQELHDGIGSSLATAKLLISRLAGHPGPANPADLIALIAELMSTTVRDVRTISHSLYPAVLSRFGLAEALQHLVDVSNETGTVPVSLEVSYDCALPLAQELALYRICQELVANALKHAQGATQLAVRLNQQSGTLTLSVQDDGCGFQPDAVQAHASKGAGLHSIGVRVQMLAARLSRRTAPGQGTLTVIELQLPT